MSNIESNAYSTKTIVEANDFAKGYYLVEKMNIKNCR
jgi:hypothetical protein